MTVSRRQLVVNLQDEKDPRSVITYPTAFVGDRFVPLTSAAIPITDQGFLQGATVTERMRTVNGQPWLLDAHLARMQRGCAALKIEIPYSTQQITDIVLQILADRVETSLDSPSDSRTVDALISLAITAGDLGPTKLNSACELDSCPPSKRSSRLVVQAAEWPAVMWRAAYRHGLELFRSEISEVPASCWPRYLKTRNRLHYYLAELDPRHRPGIAYPVLPTVEGFVAESPTATVVCWDERTRRATVPPSSDILEGITWNFLHPLLTNLGWDWQAKPLTFEQLASADEVWWLNSSAVIAPVVKWEGRLLGNGKPGPRYRELTTEISKQWGLPGSVWS